MYIIENYTKQQAKKLNVIVKPSTIKNKKIDVFTKDGQKICSIGSIHFLDFPKYIKKYGLPYAEERRRLYKIRHEKDRHNIGSPGFYSDNLLW